MSAIIVAIFRSLPHTNCLRHFKNKINPWWMPRNTKLRMDTCGWDDPTARSSVLLWVKKEIRNGKGDREGSNGSSKKSSFIIRKTKGFIIAPHRTSLKIAVDMVSQFNPLLNKIHDHDASDLNHRISSSTPAIACTSTTSKWHKITVQDKNSFPQNVHIAITFPWSNLTPFFLKETAQCSPIIRLVIADE